MLPDVNWFIGFLGDDFNDVSALHASLGPSVATRTCVSLWDNWKISVVFRRPLVSGSRLLTLSVPEEYSYAVFWEMTSEYAVFNSLLGSTVDTYLRQSTEAWGFHAFRCVKVDLGSRGRFCLVPVAVGRISHIFIVKVDTLLMSISDTRLCVSLRSLLEEFPTFPR